MEKSRKYRFIIVGSGWRSLFYVRIAKAMPEVFEVAAMLCRSEEKAEKMSLENKIYATTSIEECKAMNPDFVVVAVNKSSIADVSKEWMRYGFTVLCETPAGLDLDSLYGLWNTCREGGRLLVAEQYIYDPMYQTEIKLAESGLLGERSFLHISLAHEYHGARLMRAYLGIENKVPFTVSAQTYRFPTTETRNRYENFNDGRIADKKRTIGAFQFADGKVAVYEFDSEQYRSPIRNNYVKLQGVRGEMKDNVFCWLDEKNEPQKTELAVAERKFTRESDNPNLKEDVQCMEIKRIQENAPEEILYTAPFGVCDLSGEDTAIALLMLQAAEYHEETAKQNVRDALQDAYMAILMAEAVESGRCVASKEQPWHEDDGIIDEPK